MRNKKAINDKPAVHFVPDELLRPYNPVTVNLIGAADNTPSCSLAEALAKQDLFINSALAN